MLRISRPLLSLPAKAVPARCAASLASSRTLSLLSTSRGLKSPASLTNPHWSHSIRRTSNIPVGVDKKGEREEVKKKLEAKPEAVTSASSVRKLWEPAEGASPSDDAIKKGIESELKTFRDTFDLSSVPPLSYKLGLAGTLPYLGTSLSTLYLSWILNTQWPTSSPFLNSFMVNPETAQSLLQQLEPVQLGYGAVIISFLGAIHWGLEYAETTPNTQRTRFRYALGVAAPAVAWPTLLMPVEYALIAQFAAFTGFYFFDAQAATRGWAPPWYGTYRFVLTFVVGSAIVVSLIGRAKIVEGGNKEAAEKITESKHGALTKELPEAVWRRLEAEEKERIRKEKEESERKKEEEEKREAEKKSKQGNEVKGSKNKGQRNSGDNASQEEQD